MAGDGNQPVITVVGDRERFILIVEGDCRQNRAKDFFPGDAHLIVHSGEDRRLDEPAIPHAVTRGATTTEDRLGPLVFRNVDVVEHLLKLRRRGNRFDLRGGLHGIAHARSAAQLDDLVDELVVDLALHQNTTFDTIQAVAADVAPGQYVVLTVSDTGHGIAPDLLSKVFEPFFTTKEIGKGSGLGLSMVYGFVKQSGGHIRLRSEPGHGTSISLYFRKSMQVLTASPEDSARRAPEGGSELILVVEDDAMVRRHVSGLLGGLGYRVLEATAATPAMELLAANPDVTLLFTDIVTPGGVNGADLAKMAQGLRPDLKVLFTSGYTENAIEYEGRVDPGIELLGKPYSRDRLATSLRKVLR